MPTMTDTTELLAKRQSYRRWMNVSLWGGIVALFLATGVWVFAPIDTFVWTGVALYWLGVLGYLLIWKGTAITLFDERDEQIELEASGLTLSVVAYVVIVAIPAMVALSVTGTYTVPSPYREMLVGWLAIFVVFAVAYGHTKRQYA